MSNAERGMSKYEVYSGDLEQTNTSDFDIPCSAFDIPKM